MTRDATFRSSTAMLAAAIAAVPAALMPAGAAQAQAVVQALPDPAVDTLNEALRRLSHDPNSVPALIDAGRASLDLDDIDAAARFYDRAQQAAPRDGRVIAGLGAIAVRRRDPVTAIQLFGDAERLGGSIAGFESDRGLAHDLIGDNARAQGYYEQALARGQGEEVTRRLALSYAIAGDRARSERVLLPLLQRRDLAAYRTRAFALAILGEKDEAATIVETMLPAQLAGRLKPYLETMSRLTRAQQAAAANMGAFPATAQIGKDDARIVAAAQRAGVAAAPATQVAAATPSAQSSSDTNRRSRNNRRQSVVDSRLIPAGPTAGSAQAAAQQAQVEATRLAQETATREAAEREARELAARQQAEQRQREVFERAAAQVAASEPRAGTASAVAPAATGAPLTSPPNAQATSQPVIQPIPAASQPQPVQIVRTQTGELPPLGEQPAAQLPSAPAPSQAQVQQVIAAAPEPAATSQDPPRPSFSLTSAPETSAAQQPGLVQVAQPQPAQSPPTRPEISQPVQVSLSDAFADFALPAGQRTAGPAADAVDITKIQIKRERPPPPPEPKPEPKPEPPPPPQHPSRQWVQVATGQDIAAFRWDWRRIVRSADGLLDDQDAFHTPWGASNRLVTGPFASAKAANDFVAALKEKGVDSFRFTSTQGEELKAVPGT